METTIANLQSYQKQYQAFHHEFFRATQSLEAAEQRIVTLMEIKDGIIPYAPLHLHILYNPVLHRHLIPLMNPTYLGHLGSNSTAFFYDTSYDMIWLYRDIFTVLWDWFCGTSTSVHYLPHHHCTLDYLLHHLPHYPLDFPQHLLDSDLHCYR